MVLTISIAKQNVYVIESNIRSLQGKNPNIENVRMVERLKGYVTVGKRTQKQVQLSKKNSDNSEFFNTLRLGLYENDLLMLLKYRNEDAMEYNEKIEQMASDDMMLA